MHVKDCTSVCNTTVTYHTLKVAIVGLHHIVNELQYTQFILKIEI